MDIKQELAKKAEQKPSEVKLNKNMNIADMVRALEPEIKRALPSVITPERFTRMALSALNNNPELAKCTQMSFLAALMNAAQLGLEPNSPLQQAYLIPYSNKGKLECQFQIGYKGLLDLAYRSDNVQTVQAHIVHENDVFEYELGLESKLIHKPVLENRGEMIAVYAFYRLKNGGFGFVVMSKEDIMVHGKKYSKSFSSSFSPWNTDFESMAKKTAIRQCLKYAPLKADSLRAISTDETIKTELSVDMTEIQGETISSQEDTAYEENR